MGDEGLGVNVVATAGPTILLGRSIKRTLQPGYASQARTGECGVVNAEPVQRWQRLVRTVKKQPCAAVRSTGVQKTARREEIRGANWEPFDTSPYKVVGRRLIVIRDKSMERSRVSDEAVVSDDPMGQHNPLASQGLLGWSATVDIEGSAA